MSILDKLVSYYPSVHETDKGVSFSLLKLLQSDKHKLAIQRLSNETDLVIRKALKSGISSKQAKDHPVDYKQVIDAINTTSDLQIKRQLQYGLPCYTVSGVFEKRCNSGLIVPSYLANIDLDASEEYDLADLLIEFKKLPYIAYAGLSCSLKRLFLIVPFATDEYQKHYEALIRCFEDIDFPMGDDCHKKISQPRFVSYNDDTTQFFNHNAKPFDKLPVAKVVYYFKPNTSYIQPQDKFQFATKILEKQSCFFVDGNKHNYLFNLCRLLNKMGISKSEAEDYISSFFPLNQIKSNCITHPYKHYSNEFNSWDTKNPNAASNNFKVESSALSLPVSTAILQVPKSEPPVVMPFSTLPMLEVPAQPTPLILVSPPTPKAGKPALATQLPSAFQSSEKVSNAIKDLPEIFKTALKLLEPFDLTDIRVIEHKANP